MIKVTYNTHEEGLLKEEETVVNIFNGRMFIRYNVPNKAESVVKKMKEDGKHGVLFSRGMLIQIFAGKSEKEILEIVKKDIENGVYVAKEKTGKTLTIKDLVIHEQ